jgi:hypothetical protein
MRIARTATTASRTAALLLRSSAPTPTKRSAQHGSTRPGRLLVQHRCLPQQPRAAFSTESSTSSTSSTSADGNTSSISLLEDRTAEILQSTTKSPVQDAEIISVLHEWKEEGASGVDDNTHKHNKDTVTAATHHMKELLHHWLATRGDGRRTAEPFQIVLEHCASSHKDGPSAAAVLDEWGNLLGGDLELSPPLSAFHLVMQAYNNSDEDAADAATAQVCLDLLTFLERSHLEGNYALAPTVETYSHALSAIFSAGLQSTNNAKAVVVVDSDLMDRFQHTFEMAAVSNNQKEFSPEACYHMIRGYSKALGWGSKHDPKEGHAWFLDFENNLQRTDALTKALESKGNSKERAVSLLGRAYQSAFANLLTFEPITLEHAERAKSMIDDLASLKLDDLPWMEHYAAVVNIWTLSKSFTGADVVLQELLRRFEDQHLVPPASTTANKPDAVAAGKSNSPPLFRQFPSSIYEQIVWLWCQKGKTSEAEALTLHYMRLISHNQVKSTSDKQTTQVWNHVLAGHLKERNPGRTVEWWDRMQESAIQNNNYSYVSVLHAIARSPKSSRAIQKATQVWEMMIEDDKAEPNASHYGALILIWSRNASNQSADKAAEVLENLEAKYQETGDDSLKPLERDYTAVIAAYGRSRGDRQAAEKADAIFERMKEYYEPDSRSYNAILNVVANGRSVESAEKAETILGELELLADYSPESGAVNPSIYTYTAVVQAWSKSKSADAPERAAEVVQRLEDKFIETGDPTLCPDPIMYGLLISAWSKSRRPDAGDKAEEILGKVKDIESQTGSHLLNAVVYTNVIMSHWKSGDRYAAEKAVSLLQEMKDRVAQGDTDCIPDVVTYTIVIQSWARSPSPGKAVHAWNLLTEMCDEWKGGNLKVKPNVISFTACLNACAYTRGSAEQRKKAVETALLAMNEFQAHEYDSPSQIMYFTLLKVFCRQIREAREKEKFVGIAFNRCCQDGQVDGAILELLHDNVPELYSKLPRNPQQQVELPPEWTMNTSRRRVA